MKTDEHGYVKLDWLLEHAKTEKIHLNCKCIFVTKMTLHGPVEEFINDATENEYLEKCRIVLKGLKAGLSQITARRQVNLTHLTFRRCMNIFQRKGFFG